MTPSGPLDPGEGTRRVPDPRTPPNPASDHPRSRRLRAPLLVALGVLLAVEALGGLLIFFMRLATGEAPGETLHVAAGALLTIVYVVYQFQHWSRVAPWRSRLDFALGLIAALSMAGALGTGLWLALPWWQVRVVTGGGEAVPYAPSLRAAHNVMSMLVLTFTLSHLAAVLMRDAAAKRR